MATKGDITPKLRRRIRELRDSTTPPMSLRKIEAALETEGHRVSHMTVSAILAEPVDGPPIAPGAPRTRRQALPDCSPRPDVLALPEDATPAQRVIHGRLLDVARTIDDLRGDVLAGDYEATKWVALIREERELASALQDLTPIRPPDPALDPANEIARAAVHQTLVELVAVCEEDAGVLCSRCLGKVA
jgi:hypothetical protein